jgi:hypothetical protein
MQKAARDAGGLSRLEPLRYEPQAALFVGAEPQAALFRFAPFMNDLPIDYAAVLTRPA